MHALIWEQRNDRNHVTFVAATGERTGVCNFMLLNNFISGLYVHAILLLSLNT